MSPENWQVFLLVRCVLEKGYCLLVTQVLSHQGWQETKISLLSSAIGWAVDCLVPHLDVVYWPLCSGPSFCRILCVALLIDVHLYAICLPFLLLCLYYSIRCSSPVEMAVFRNCLHCVLHSRSQLVKVGSMYGPVATVLTSDWITSTHTSEEHWLLPSTTPWQYID